MKVKFLGTAAAEGWPALFCNCANCVQARKLGGKNIRTRSQTLINNDLLIDFPQDTYLHVLNHGVDLTRVQNVLVTHAHDDHFYPQDLFTRIEPYAYNTGDFTLNVYGDEHVQTKYNATIGEWATWDISATVKMNVIPEFQELKIGKYTVWALLADHQYDERCLFYIIQDEEDGKTMLYAHDTGIFPDASWDFLKSHSFRFDFVSMDCTAVEDAWDRNHMGLPYDVKMKEELIAHGMADEDTIFYVNHFSHGCALTHHDQMVELAASYGFQVSFDGCEVVF